MDSWEKYPGCARRIWGNNSTYCCWIFSAPWISSLVCSTFVFTFFFCIRDNKIKGHLHELSDSKPWLSSPNFFTLRRITESDITIAVHSKKKNNLENKRKEWLQRKTRWQKSSQMCSTSLSVDTSGIHLQMQKISQNTSWEQTGVPDHWKGIHRSKTQQDKGRKGKEEDEQDRTCTWG